MKKILLVGILLFTINVHAEEIIILEFGEPVEVLLKGSSEYCLVDIVNNNVIGKTDCIKLVNSKNIKILCTKNKKLCKTEEEIITHILQVGGSAKADSYYEDDNDIFRECK